MLPFTNLFSLLPDIHLVKWINAHKCKIFIFINCIVWTVYLISASEKSKKKKKKIQSVARLQCLTCFAILQTLVYVSKLKHYCDNYMLEQFSVLYKEKNIQSTESWYVWSTNSYSSSLELVLNRKLVRILQASYKSVERIGEVNDIQKLFYMCIF